MTTFAVVLIRQTVRATQFHYPIGKNNNDNHFFTQLLSNITIAERH